MNSRLSWPARIALCFGILGFAYTVAEDLVPALRPGPPESAIQTCEQFSLGMEMSQASDIAAKGGLRISEANGTAIVGAGGSCKCALDGPSGRIQRNRVVCGHTHRILFGGAA